MDDLRRAREEIRSLREVLQRTQDERDKWKNRNHGMLAECYKIIKQHGLDSGEQSRITSLRLSKTDLDTQDLSLTTLQNLDTPAAVGRLEEHDRYMRNLFGKDSCDLAATVQNIVLEIQYVKTEMSGDTLRWRLCSALNLMQHISRRLQEACFRKSQDRGTKPYRPDLMSDTYLRSTLKSADVQLLSTLNEVRERGMVDHFQTFRKRFAPEYDMVHNECALEFYEKTKALMIRMYSQGRTTVKPQRRVEEIVLRDKLDEEEEIVETTWI